MQILGERDECAKGSTGINEMLGCRIAVGEKVSVSKVVVCTGKESKSSPMRLNTLACCFSVSCNLPGPRL